MGTHVSQTDLTPEAARDALESVEQMKRAGGQRGEWPAWFFIMETVYLAGVITAAGVAAIHREMSIVIIAVFLCLPGIWFRSKLLKRRGAFLRPNWIDAGILLLLVALQIGSVAVGLWYDVDWLAWAAGPTWAAARLIRIAYKLRRAEAATGEPRA